MPYEAARTRVGGRRKPGRRRPSRIAARSWPCRARSRRRESRGGRSSANSRAGFCVTGSIKLPGIGSLSMPDRGLCCGHARLARGTRAMNWFELYDLIHLRRRALAAALMILACTVPMSTPVRADDGGQALAEAAGRELIGTPAPRLVLKTIDGQSIDLG